MRRLAAEGVAILFICHLLSEVIELADELTVLRDGALVSSGPLVDYTTGRIVREMVGRDAETRAAHPLRAAVLEVEGLRAPVPAPSRGIDLRVGAGEIVGLAGLMGSGRSRLAARSPAGIPPRRRPRGGERPAPRQRPLAAIRPASPSSPRTARRRG